MNIDELSPVKQVKIRYWLDIIKECRASGLTNQDWCERNGVSLKSYYYYLAKIRKLSLADLPYKKIRGLVQSDVQVGAPTTEVSFVELPIPPAISAAASSLTLRVGDMALEITSDTTPELLHMVLQVVHRC